MALIRFYVIFLMMRDTLSITILPCYSRLTHSLSNTHTHTNTPKHTPSPMPLFFQSHFLWRTLSLSSPHYIFFCLSMISHSGTKTLFLSSSCTPIFLNKTRDILTLYLYLSLTQYQSFHLHSISFFLSLSYTHTFRDNNILFLVLLSQYLN